MRRARALVLIPALAAVLLPASASADKICDFDTRPCWCTTEEPPFMYPCW